MATIDPQSVIEGLGAFKIAIDSVRSAIGIVKDVRSVEGSTEQKKAIDSALTVASTNTAIAEATLGHAFGYQMCKCTFPPTPMLTVGYFDVNLGHSRNTGDPVYECPKCGITNAGPYNFKRTAILSR